MWYISVLKKLISIENSLIVIYFCNNFYSLETSQVIIIPGCMTLSLAIAIMFQYLSIISWLSHRNPAFRFGTIIKIAEWYVNVVSRKLQFYLFVHSEFFCHVPFANFFYWICQISDCQICELICQLSCQIFRHQCRPDFLTRKMAPRAFMRPALVRYGCRWSSISFVSTFVLGNFCKFEAICFALCNTYFSWLYAM